eukprot:maker-scaffold176_size284796-snap-gene-0.12 protein:Tk06849 transcript:maker-scaffold176_size284796-snap-gene-0.12-mRNA-1 annotation:"synapsin-like isoform x1"
MPADPTPSQCVGRASRHLNNALKDFGRTLENILDEEDTPVQLAERSSLKDEYRLIQDLFSEYQEALTAAQEVQADFDESFAKSVEGRVDFIAGRYQKLLSRFRKNPNPGAEFESPTGSSTSGPQSMKLQASLKPGILSSKASPLDYASLSSGELNNEDREEDIEGLLDGLSSDAINSHYDERLDTKEGGSGSLSEATSPSNPLPPIQGRKSSPDVDANAPETAHPTAKKGGGGLSAVVAAATLRQAVAADSSGGEESSRPESARSWGFKDVLSRKSLYQSGDQTSETDRNDLDLKTQPQGGRPQPGQPGSKTLSAPTSPMKDKKAGFFGKVSSFSQVVSAKVEQAKDAAGSIRGPGINKDRCFTLLVIDDANTDWSKYFRGRRVQTDFDIRVEQAEFSELSVNATAEHGVTASIIMQKTGNKVVRSFRPDFLLIRQNLRDAKEDYRKLILGFKYSDIPSVNSLDSIYNFQDKPWVFANMLKVQSKVGKDHFPLIDQTYFPSYKEMVTCGPNMRYPCVLKIGHAHSGMGKSRVDNATQFQDLTSVIAVADNYCTVEPYIDAKFDLHVQKIGSNYKALMRKSLSGNWKTNMGQSILEEIAVSAQYKAWIDALSEMFGGLDICSLEAMVAKDGKEFIIEVNDSATTLLGESQEEDRKNIAELVIKAMEDKCKAPPLPPGVTPPVARTTSRSSISRSSISSTTQDSGVGISAQSAAPKESTTAATSGRNAASAGAPAEARKRHDSQASESSTVSGVSSASSTVKKEARKPQPGVPGENGEEVQVGENEDTMKNLRKTFAGIFGDIN